MTKTKIAQKGALILNIACVCKHYPLSIRLSCATTCVSVDYGLYENWLFNIIAAPFVGHVF